MATDAILEAELERKALHALRAAWEHFNWAFFDNFLLLPAFELSSARTRLGQWDSASRTLSLSRAMVFDEPWVVVEEVLKHEMAHQFVDEALRKRDETAHGPAFREVCARMAIDPSATGPVRVAANAPAEQKIIEKVARLLRLATSPEQHEAEAATALARKLMLKHNVEAPREGRAYGYAHLGVPTGRVPAAQRLLARILQDHFFVQCIWVRVYQPRVGKSGSVLEICGTASNLAIAEYVHAYLTATAEELWKAHKRECGVRGNRDRLVFVAGVMDGFRKKLTREVSSLSAETGLIWTGDPGLDRYFSRRHPRVQQVMRGSAQRNAAFGAGHQAGQSIVLRKAVDAEPSARGLLLGPGKR